MTEQATPPPETTTQTENLVLLAAALNWYRFNPFTWANPNHKQIIKAYQERIAQITSAKTKRHPR